MKIKSAENNSKTLFIENSYTGETAFSKIVRLYKGEKSSLILASFYYVIKHSPTWVMPLITANIINILSEPEKHKIGEIWLNGLILALILVQNIPFHFLYIRYLSKSVRRIETLLRSTLCHRLQVLSLSYYAKKSAGILQSKVLRDVENIEQMTRIVFDAGLTAATNIVFALIVTAFRVPSFLIFYIIVVPIAAFLVKSMREVLAERNKTFRTELEKLSSRVIEMTHLIPITRAHALENNELQRVDNTLNKVQKAGLALDSINAAFGAAAWVVFNIFNMLCLIISAYLYWNKMLNLSLGDVVLLTSYFGTLTGSVMALTSLSPQLTKGIESIKSMSEVLEAPELEDNEGKKTVQSVKGKISFKNITFTYPESNEHAIKNFSLEIKEGETVAFVGPSGAGKSTILNLVIGFIRPSLGEILLDGEDMNSLDLRTFRKFLSIVPQDTILFEGSVRENITYGIKSISEIEIENALRDSNAWEFVSKLPNGIDTYIGEKGAKLSGGQKQRLAIARALIRNPKVLVLDEATSALDTESEFLIQEALIRLMKNRTTLVVAHRLSTIKHADKIVVLERGVIVETGRHEELLNQNGLYSKLYR